MNSTTAIKTRMGKFYDIFAPTPDMVSPHDIAAALSSKARFNGHAREFYSVAQHCVHVSQQVELMMRGEPWLWEACYAALLHDAAEAYMVDIPRPQKKVAGFLIDGRYVDFETVEERNLRNIFTAFGWDHFPFDIPCVAETVREADDVLLVTEARDLLDGTEDWPNKSSLPEPLAGIIAPSSPMAAGMMFWNRWDCLSQNLNLKYPRMF